MQYKWHGDNKLCIPGLAKVNPGSLFEMEDMHLVNAGVQVLMNQGLITPITQEAPAESGRDSGEEAPEPEEDLPLLPDITEMNTKDAVEFIQNLTDKDSLTRLKEMEEAGKNRTSILNALEKQLSG